MKKLLLGLGTLSLAALPVLSCSSTTPTLQTEGKKFKDAKTLIATLTPTGVSKAIVSASTSDEKKQSLLNIINFLS